jgi:hypothetical protein
MLPSYARKSDATIMPAEVTIQGHPDPAGNRFCHVLADAISFSTISIFEALCEPPGGAKSSLSPRVL